MNRSQALWWDQAKSDFLQFDRLRSEKFATCHALHYLQMATEKLSKAYLWRSGKVPPKAHTGFVQFLRALVTRREPDFERIAGVFGFGRGEDLDNWVTTALPLAYRVMNLAPALANNGPNPEYPWPHESPVSGPVGFAFPLWTELVESNKGGRFVEFVRVAVREFEKYA